MITNDIVCGISPDDWCITKDTVIRDGWTHGDIGALLTWHCNRSPLTDDVPSATLCFWEVKVSFIHLYDHMISFHLCESFFSPLQMYFLHLRVVKDNIRFIWDVWTQSIRLKKTCAPMEFHVHLGLRRRIGTKNDLASNPSEWPYWCPRASEWGGLNLLLNELPRESDWTSGSESDILCGLGRSVFL